MDQARKKTLLVVDDEEGPRQSIRIVFQQEYHVLLASGFEEALAHARAQPVDVAVLDIRMVGHSGIEVLQMLKEIDPSIEVIMLTAYETLETARQALRFGARDYIGKPFDVETLRRAVANAMMHRKISGRIHQVEDELMRISGELAETVAREDMTRSINEVYAGILHDINNPLTIVNCFLDIVMERVSSTDVLGTPEVRQLRDQLATISRQIKICSEISSRHLDYLRRPSNTTASSLNLVLRDLSELIKVHPIIRSGDIQVEPLENDAEVPLSSAELTQILLNLMINALQSSGDTQAIRVSAKIHREPVHPSIFRDAPGQVFLHADTFRNQPPFVSVTVQDQAGGIPGNIVHEIFEPYFTTRSRDKGTGLGLSIVSKVVKSAQGALHLESVLGQGSSFTIFLPCHNGH